MVRFTGFAAAVALALLSSPAALVTFGALGESEARADEQQGNDLSIGTELQATSDLTLHKAEIVKGSRVSVTKLNLREGKLDSVNVALADGHVVKMPLVAVRSYFRVVSE